MAYLDIGALAIFDAMRCIISHKHLQGGLVSILTDIGCWRVISNFRTSRSNRGGFGGKIGSFGHDPRWQRWDWRSLQFGLVRDQGALRLILPRRKRKKKDIIGTLKMTNCVLEWMSTWFWKVKSWVWSPFTRKGNWLQNVYNNSIKNLSKWNAQVQGRWIHCRSIYNKLTRDILIFSTKVERLKTELIVFNISLVKNF